MKNYFENAEAVARLQFHALEWLGTPFMPNAAVKGRGVSCQKLVSAIYIETGFFPAGFTAPEGPMDWGNAQKESLIARWVAAHPDLFAPATAARPGDLLGLKIGGCIHHCGIVVDTGGQFIHCLRGPGAILSHINDATYLQRIEKIWRPVMEDKKS